MTDRPRRQRRFPVWFRWLIVAMIFTHAALNITRPMTSYRALALGADAATIGLLTTAFALLPLFVTIPAGRVADRRGGWGLMQIGLALCALATVALAYSPNLWTLALGNAGLGLGQMCTMISAQGLAARSAPDSGQDRAFGLFTVSVSLGQLLGPIVAGMVADAGAGDRPDASQALIVAAVITALALAVMLLNRGPGRPMRSDSGKEPAPPRSIRAIGTTRGLPSAVVTSMAMLAAMDIIIVYLPVLGEERGLSATTVGWLLALRALASMSSRLLLVPMVNRLGRRTLLTASMTIPAVMLIAMPYVEPLPLTFVLMGAFGFFIGLGMPLTMSWVSLLVPANERATALSLRMAGNRVSQVVVPTIAGMIAGVTGTAGVFILLAALLSGGSVEALRRAPRRSAEREPA